MKGSCAQRGAGRSIRKQGFMAQNLRLPKLYCHHVMHRWGSRIPHNCDRSTMWDCCKDDSSWLVRKILDFTCKTTEILGIVHVYVCCSCKAYKARVDKEKSFTTDTRTTNSNSYQGTSGWAGLKKLTRLFLAQQQPGTTKIQKETHHNQPSLKTIATTHPEGLSNDKKKPNNNNNNNNRYSPSTTITTTTTRAAPRVKGPWSGRSLHGHPQVPSPALISRETAMRSDVFVNENIITVINKKYVVDSDMAMG